VRGALTDVRTGKVQMGKWHENIITNIGYQDYLCAWLGTASGSKNFTHIAVASGSSQNATMTQLSGEASWSVRKAPGFSVVSSKTLQATASWASSEMSNQTLNCCGFYNTSAVTTGSVASIGTFASSTKSDVQTFTLTYNLAFS
jgi:hypothetical protein